MVDQPYQFDFYDGGGLDIAFLSFAEVDAGGNVNVSRFGDTIVGIGGFVNISQNARKVVFSGTFTAGGLEIRCEGGKLRIVTEGRNRKFVQAVEQICYNGAFARSEGRDAVFVTERRSSALAAAGWSSARSRPASTWSAMSSRTWRSGRRLHPTSSSWMHGSFPDAHGPEARRPVQAARHPAAAPPA